MRKIIFLCDSHQIVCEQRLISLDYTLEGTIKATGNLTIDGYTKRVEMTANYQAVDKNKVKFSGEVPIDMTKNNMAPTIMKVC